MTRIKVGRTEPVAYVTKGKHRIKQYKNSTVYLNNGDEFELELFNPTSNKVLCKIYLNENSIGAGIVLRPGERAFIERYIEESRKFMFQTYEVNATSDEVKKAIANNGNVRVAFYKEELPTTYWGTTTWTTTWPTWYGGGTYTSNIGSSPTFGPQDWDGLKDSHCFYSNSADGGSEISAQACMDSLDFSAGDDNNTLGFVNQNLTRGIIDLSANLKGSSSGGRKMSKSRSKSVETGRIDKGSHSEQTFQHDYSSFETYWTWETKWKILPLSQKPIVTEDIKVFCTSCGAKQKKASHKFCPHCGTRY
jgi:hypothetical protein